MSLKKAATSGVRWSLFSQVGKLSTQFITTAILARLLAPSDFGLMGLATLVIAFIDLFRDLGTSAAIIQQKNHSKTLLHTIFWVNVSCGVLGMIMLFTLAPLVASFYQEPKVLAILQFLSLNFLLAGISTLQKTMLEKDLQFTKIAIVEITSLVFGSLIGIKSAISGLGVWSLVYQSITVISTSTVLFWIANKWRPRMIFSWSELKEVSGYSLNLTGFSIFNYFVRNADYILIGKFLGPQELGFYTLAYRLMLFPLQNVSHVLSRIMFPVFSKLQDDDGRLRSAYLTATSAIALITFPVMTGLCVLAGPFVRAFFGAQWEPLIWLLMILAPVGMMQSIETTVGTIYQSKGRTDLMFRWSLIEGSILIITFWLGLQKGILGVAAIYAIVYFVLIYPNFSIPFRLINLRIHDLGLTLWRPLAASLVMVLVLLELKFLLPASLGDTWNLGISVLTGVIVYLLASLLINREQVLQLFNILGLRKT